MRIGLIVPGFSADESDWCIPALLNFVRALAEREELVARGLSHAGRFTWLDTGRIHLRSYADAL